MFCWLGYLVQDVVSKIVYDALFFVAQPLPYQKDLFYHKLGTVNEWVSKERIASGIFQCRQDREV